MNSPRIRALLAVTFAIATSSLVALCAHAQTSDNAEFVFVGQVVDDGPPAALARPRPGTASVRVDRILKPEASSMFGGFKGQIVGVRLRNPEEPGTGGVATFFTRIAAMGKALELVEIEHRAAPDAASANAQVEQAAALGEQVLTERSRAEVERRVAGASVVFAGRVLSVQPAVGVAAQGERLSEHDPQWQEAVIEVGDVLKGAVANEQVTLRFPGSRDAAWYHAPKLAEGQQDIFLLGPDGTVLSQGTAAPGTPAPAVTRGDNVLPMTDTNLRVVAEAVKRRPSAD
jgi:hypothetical protein